MRSQLGVTCLQLDHRVGPGRGRPPGAVGQFPVDPSSSAARARSRRVSVSRSSRNPVKVQSTAINPRSCSPTHGDATNNGGETWH